MQSYLSNQDRNSDDQSRPKSNLLNNRAALADDEEEYPRGPSACLDRYKYLCLNFHEWFQPQEILRKDKLEMFLEMYCVITSTIITSNTNLYLQDGRIYYDFGCYFACQNIIEKPSIAVSCPMKVLVSAEPWSNDVRIESVNLIHNHLIPDNGPYLRLYLKTSDNTSKIPDGTLREILSSMSERNTVAKAQKAVLEDNSNNFNGGLIVGHSDQMNAANCIIEEEAMREMNIKDNADFDREIGRDQINSQDQRCLEEEPISVGDPNYWEAKQEAIKSYVSASLNSSEANALNTV